MHRRPGRPGGGGGGRDRVRAGDRFVAARVRRHPGYRRYRLSPTRRARRQPPPNPGRYDHKDEQNP